MIIIGFFCVKDWKNALENLQLGKTGIVVKVAV
jgi:hypothetical protein